jgi:hypothetical protein
MPDDLSGAHAAGVHRHDLFVEAWEAPLVLGDELRIEARLAVARHGEVELARLRRDRLAAVAVTTVSGSFGACEMMVHLGVQRPISQRLL